MFNLRIPKAPKDYTMLFKRGTQNPETGRFRGGVAILVKHNTPYTQINLQTELQAIAIKIQLDKLYTVCSIYLPPQANIHRAQLENLIQQLPQPYLLLGDLNARHPLWGDDFTNTRGRMMEIIINSGPVCILNDGTPTHLHTQTDTLSCPDLSVCSADIAADYLWKVHDDLHGSDHFPILLTSTRYREKIGTPRFRFNKADWTRFAVESFCRLRAADFETVDEACSHLQRVILDAAIKTIPKTGRPRDRPMPWWNDDLERAKREKKRAVSRYKASLLGVDKAAMNRVNARMMKLTKEARERSWQQFATTLNSRTPMEKVWKRIKKISGKFTPPVAPMVEVNGSLLAEPRAVANAFGNHLSDVSRGNILCDQFTRHKQQAARHPPSFRGGEGEGYNRPLTMRELKAALGTCENTAAGADEIYYIMIKNLPDTTLEFLLSLYNRIWTEQTFPTSWELATILPFQKKHKDHKNLNNYRPIALTSCMCKLMEKVVNARMVWYLETNNILSQEQYGYRKFRSTTDALVRLETYIREAFARKQHVYAVFFDMEKAYDIAWRGGILQSMHNAGLKGNLPQFVKGFLSTRRMQVRVGGMMSDEFEQFEGVPQGSVLSCTCFALAINGLPSVLPQYVEGSLYVDDFAIFSSSSSIPVLKRRMQTALNRIETWVDTHGFKLSVEKTKMVHFTRRRGQVDAPDLVIGNAVLQVVNEMRFLGLIFDRKLTWVPHIKDLKVRCIKALNPMKYTSNQNWGADRHTLLRLYRALVRSKLDYGCQAYASAATTTLEMLNSVHHLGIRLAIGAFRTSPAESLYAESGEPPLQLRREKLCLQLYARLMRQPDTPTYRAITNQADDLTNRYRDSPSLIPPFGPRVAKIIRELRIEMPPIHTTALPQSEPWLAPETVICAGITHQPRNDAPEGALRALFLDHQTEHSESTSVYTDGSKTDRGVGWAAVFPTRTINGTLPRHASVFTAELTAINSALQLILERPETNFTIYTDSRSSLQAIKIIYPDQSLVLTTHSLLTRISSNHNQQVTFCWVPAHVGVAGNERADAAARDMTDQDNPIQNSPLSHRECYSIFNTAIRNAWQTKWSGQTGNKLRAIKETITPWNTSYRRNRREEVILTRLRIGHIRATHEFLLKGEEHPTCQTCNERLTVQHILITCPNYGVIRRRVFDPGGNRPATLTLKHVLGDDDFMVQKLFQFLLQTGVARNI